MKSMKNVKKGVNVIQFPEQKKDPGRNDPCPCGSGKKFKKCCGDEKRAIEILKTAVKFKSLYCLLLSVQGQAITITARTFDVLPEDWMSRIEVEARLVGKEPAYCISLKQDEKKSKILLPDSKIITN